MVVSLAVVIVPRWHRNHKQTSISFPLAVMRRRWLSTKRSLQTATTTGTRVSPTIEMTERGVPLPIRSPINPPMLDTTSSHSASSITLAAVASSGIPEKYLRPLKRRPARPLRKLTHKHTDPLALGLIDPPACGGEIVSVASGPVREPI